MWGGDAFSTIEAETLSESQGASVGEEYIGSLFHGDWALYENVNFNNKIAVGFQITLGKANDVATYIDVFIDDLSGQNIGTIEVPSTGGWATWETVVTEVNEVSGVHDVYLSFRSTDQSEAVANVESFQFLDKCGFGFDVNSLIEAEDYCEMLGVEMDDSSDGDGTMQVTHIQDGDYLRFGTLDFDTEAITSVSFRASSQTNGGPTGILLESVEIFGTGNWNTWETTTVDIEPIIGSHDLYLVFKQNDASDNYLFNLNWFEFLRPVSSTLLDIKVMLESCYSGSGVMTNNLDGVIPSSEPYTNLGYNLTDDTSKSIGNVVLSQTGVDKVIDWVVIELRETSDMTTVLVSRAALLLADGRIVDLDGISLVNVSADVEAAYVVVRQRNHLGVMSKNPISLVGSTVLDFTDVTNVYSDDTISNEPAKEMDTGIYVMYQGDVNGDGEINSSDAVTVFGGVIPVVLNTYNILDVDMDGNLSTTDAGEVFKNAVPVVRQHF